ncbi:hypothetical protein IGI04_019498 [Brassica rapa subsp. trilocularis]|uniref:RING-type domain-containing protein n=1 Tax=Brassica rapa subsp. trilocularis TaxID=1813537 RepID=A0ABQ7MG09_BRACM|nr:hypothetical protein IGI04_019498 [Brassica rapa subsp. trilocularis]
MFKEAVGVEKQKLKLQDEIIAEKEKTKALLNALAQITQDKKEIEKPEKGENIAKLLEEQDKLEGSYESEANNDRECIICMKDEVSVVFYPCAHQVMCSCSDSFFSGNNNGGNKVTCPCCRSLVQQRIHIFGATS